MRTLPKIVNAIALFLLVKVLILVLVLFAWDYYETKEMLNAVEVQRDNAVWLNHILQTEVDACGGKHAHTR